MSFSLTWGCSILALAASVLLIGCSLGENRPKQVAGGDSIHVNSLGMTFEYVPAGTFEMGSTEGDEDERPVHDVEITEPFYLARTEVTQRRWEQVMSENPSVFRAPYRPVDSVSWHQANAFVDSLNRREDTDRYRLPTEAEWEYAARGGSGTRYYFGTARDSLSEHAWYGINAEERTHDVGRLRGNPFGLQDMYGNVWEWVEDAYDASYYERARPTDPLNRGTRSEPRVIRGGGWYGSYLDLRSANRAWARPGAADAQLGFRVVYETADDE